MLMTWKVSLTFFFTTYSVQGFTLRSLTHLKYISIKFERHRSCLISQPLFSMFNIVSWWCCHFSRIYFCHLCHQCVACIWDPDSALLLFMSVLLAEPWWFLLCCLWKITYNQLCWYLQNSSFCSGLIWLSGVLCATTCVLTLFFLFLWVMTFNVLRRLYSNQLVDFSEYNHFMILNLSHEAGKSFQILICF